MSELSRAISDLKICNVPGNPELRKQLKEVFRLGWCAREALLNKRIAEVEKAATQKEREHATNDACRYRLLRDIALLDGALAATIEIEQLDFVKEADTFDGIVDGLKQ